MKYLLLAVCLFCFRPSPVGAVGPFELSGSDSTTIKLQLAAQLQTVLESKDLGAGKGHEITTFMKARRIRPSLLVSVPKYKSTFRLHLSMAPGSIELMDMYFDSKISSKMSLRIGQYKIPFTRYRIQSFQRLTFVDWSLVTKYFGAERQIGLSVHNGYEKPPRYAYAIGIFDGVNARASHTVGLASVFGEKVANPSDLTGSSPRNKFHPELVGHFAINSDDIDVRSDTDAKGGQLRYSIASSAACDFSPKKYEDFVARAAQEFLMKYRHFSLMGTGYIGFIRMDGADHVRKAITGLLVQSSYRATDNLEFALRYAYVEIDMTVADRSYSRAQAIIAGTSDATIISQYKNAGMVLAEHEGTIGCNLYLDNHNFKIQNDFGFITDERRGENRTNYLIRSQIQIAF